MIGGSDRPAAGSSLTTLTFVVAVGILYGLAEFVRQRWIAPSPLGLPGDAGGDLAAYLALGVTVFGIPAAFGLLVGRGRFFGIWLAWTLAIAPTLTLVVMRVGTLRRAPWAMNVEQEPQWAVPILAACLIAAAAATILALALRPLRLGRGWEMASLGLALAAPFLLWLRLPEPTLTAARAEETEDDRPNVVLLTIDTLRADAVTHVTAAWPSPALDRQVVASTWTNSPWTRPAMASFFSGVVPTGHGADEERAPSTEVSWFVEDLRDAGYRTLAVVANPHLRRRFGFDRGFDFFEHEGEYEFLEPIARSFWAEWWVEAQGIEDDHATADRMVPGAEAALRDHAGDGPWLLWVHLVDPHIPYHLRGPNGATRPQTRGSWVEPLADVLVDDRFNDLWPARRGEIVTTPTERGALRRLYQTEVDFALHWSARLLRSAGDVSAGRDLVWMMTSDHGEEFWDAGGFEHGHTMHPSVTEVPLWIGGSRRVDAANAPRRLIDVGPWLLAQVGVDGRDPREGSGLLDEDFDLTPFALGSAFATREVLAEGMLYGPPRTLLRWPDGARAERNEDDRSLRFLPEAVDDAARARAEALWIQLDLWRERSEAKGRAVDLSPDLIRQLQAIGYVQ